MKVKVVNLSKGPNRLKLPTYACKYDDAVDLKACFNLEKSPSGEYYSSIDFYDEDNKKVTLTVSELGQAVLYPRCRVLIPTGLKMEVPIGYKFTVKSRSGLSLKNGIRVMNSPGTVDSPYRGMVGVILINDSEEPFVIEHGNRIAQGCIEKTTEIEWEEVESESMLSSSERESDGIGHTGIK